MTPHGTLTAAFVIAIAVVAPQRPSFAGKWALDVAASSSAGGGRGTVDTAGGGRGGGLGLGPSAEALIVGQTAGTLTIDERRGEATTRVVYRLDGANAEIRLGAGRSAGAAATAVSRWQGSRLITTITLPAAAGQDAVIYEESRWIEPDHSMVVEIRRPGLTNFRRSIYRKSAP
jgi:hypothetical protein